MSLMRHMRASRPYSSSVRSYPASRRQTAEAEGQLRATIGLMQRSNNHHSINVVGESSVDVADCRGVAVGGAPARS